MIILEALSLTPMVRNSEISHQFNCSHYYANNIEGEFLYKDLIPGDLDLRDSTPSLQGEEKQLFLEFVGKMLRWVPEDRKTAKELLADPWLLRNAPSKR